MGEPSADLLSDVVASTYALLLSSPDLDLDGLAARLDRPVAEIAGALDRLVELSLVHRSELERQPIQPVNPALAMQQLIARERTVLDERQRRLEQSYEALSSVLAGFSSRGEDSPSERLEGLGVIRARLQGLAMSTREEVLSFSPAALDPGDTRSASRPLDLGGLARGVRMRTVYLDTIAYEPSALEYAGELVNAGAEIRVAQELPLRMIIADRRVAVVPTEPGSRSTGALLIRDPGPLAALVALFESYWRTARPLQVDDSAADECSAMEQAILAQLATGAKDEAVARHLGLSVRSLRRVIADLTQRVGARSRFELGVRAATRGWL